MQGSTPWLAFLVLASSLNESGRVFTARAWTDDGREQLLDGLVGERVSCAKTASKTGGSAPGLNPLYSGGELDCSAEVSRPATSRYSVSVVFRVLRL